MRYGKDISLPNPQPEEDSPVEEVQVVEQVVTEIRGKGFSGPADEEGLRNLGLVVCFIKDAPTRPLNVMCNGISYDLPVQQWIKVPTPVRDILANAGLL